MLYSDMWRYENRDEIRMLSDRISVCEDAKRSAERHLREAEKKYMLARLSGDPVRIYRTAIELHNAKGIIQQMDSTIAEYNQKRLAYRYGINYRK